MSRPVGHSDKERVACRRHGVGLASRNHGQQRSRASTRRGCACSRKAVMAPSAVQRIGCLPSSAVDGRKSSASSFSAQSPIWTHASSDSNDPTVQSSGRDQLPSREPLAETKSSHFRKSIPNRCTASSRTNIGSLPPCRILQLARCLQSRHYLFRRDGHERETAIDKLPAKVLGCCVEQ